MKIEPIGETVYLKIDGEKRGVLDTSSRNSAVEFGEVLAVGEGIKDLKVGDKVFVKAWAIDIVSYNDQKYYFCNINTKGILAKVNGVR